VPALPDPIEPHLARALRRAVLDHRAARSRSETTLHLGEPAGRQVRYVVRRHEELDAALRTDVVAALLLRVREEAVVEGCLVWLARPGDLDWQDADAQWLSAARAAFGEAGVPLRFAVVTRDGWVDPHSGAGVAWKRLRDRRARRPR
jgi:hypothetical protein